MVAFMFDVAGLASSFELGNGGSRFRDVSAILEARDNADGDFVVFRNADGVGDDDSVTIRQLNAALFGLFWIGSAVVLSDANVALTGEQTIDGVLTSDDRVLLIAQTDPIQNGWWVTNSSAWSRPGDFSDGASAQSKTSMVSQGSVYADTQWTIDTDDPNAIIGTDTLSLVQIAAGGSITAIADDATATGQTIISDGSGPTARLFALLGEENVLTFANVAGDVTLSVDTGGIGTTKLGDGSVTEIKLSANVILVRRVAFDFNDVGTNAIGAAVPAGVAVSARINVTIIFNGASTAEIGHAGDASQLMATGLSDLSRLGLFLATIDETLVPATVYNVTVAGAAPTTGAAIAQFEFELS